MCGDNWTLSATLHANNEMAAAEGFKAFYRFCQTCRRSNVTSEVEFDRPINVEAVRTR